jgi:hypothetical protein
MPFSCNAPDINIRSSGYFIACATGTCWCCEAPTPVIGLGMPPAHETLSMDAERGESEPDSWESAACNALMFYIEYLPDAVRRRLANFSPFYRPGHDPGSQESYWANHCEKCGSLLDDQDLFCEPDGPFLPTSEASAAGIHLFWIDEPIEAAAAGYALDPQFFPWPFIS